MNKVGIHLIAAAALLGCMAARAQDADATGTADAAPAAAPAAPEPGSDTPYASIIARNMFGLVPIPPPDPNAGLPPPDPPPKITPNGIMTIFGRDQALFKVADKPKPGQPAKDNSYVLAEGERQDDIEVLKINHTDGIITFNNHGTVQELPLVAAKDAGGPAGGSGGGPGNGGGIPRPGFGNRPAPSFGAMRPAMGMSGGLNSAPSFNRNGANASGQGGLAFGGGGTTGGMNQSQNGDAPMTIEQQEFLIETQRKIAQEQGDPIAPILPPTAGNAKQIIQALSESSGEQ